MKMKKHGLSFLIFEFQVLSCFFSFSYFKFRLTLFFLNVNAINHVITHGLIQNIIWNYGVVQINSFQKCSLILFGI
jgi:hypothetical protein